MKGISTVSTGKADLSREITAFKSYIKERSTSGLTRLHTASQKTTKSGGEARYLHEVVSTCEDCFIDRKLFSTQSGLLSLSPPVVRKGDICCILFSVAVPMILRQVGLNYRLVGEAYINGVMQSEAFVDFLLAEKYKKQIFGKI